MRGASRVIALALVVVLGSCAIAAAGSRSAHFRDVGAVFTFDGRFPIFSHPHLTIIRAGMVAYNKPVSSQFCAPCGPALDPGQPTVRVLDLENDGEPDVALTLSAYGGARCCLVGQVFSYDPLAKTYVKVERNFTDTGAGLRVEDVTRDGHYEFVSSDPAFFGAFSDLAGSGEPIQIWIFRTLSFLDVTCNYPAAVAADAGRWWRVILKQKYSYDEGYVAAWAADESLLGRERVVDRALARLLNQHRLTADSFRHRSGQQFVIDLRRFLHKHGYVSGCRRAPPYTWRTALM